MAAKLIFYTTKGCHLCEFAAEMLQQLQQNHGESALEIETVDISSSEQLVNRYGLTIPVVRNPASGEELNWPFEPAQIANLF